MVKGKRTGTGGRGSAQAIEKRRVARQLNALFGPAPGENGKLDGRTEKRRARLLKELKEGRAGQPLKPIEIITHADELLTLGETLASIRKNGLRMQKSEGSFSDDQREAVQRAQAAYGFRPEVWKLLGIDLERGEETRERAVRSGPAKKKRSVRG
jgi:hypothetical protein